MPFWFVNPRLSPAWKFAEIDTVALARLVLSGWRGVTPPSTATPALPSGYAVFPPVVVTVGAVLVAVTPTLRVATLLAGGPSSQRWVAPLLVGVEGFWLVN